MSTTNTNSWNKPWSIQEIIDNAPNWSLAGDAGLLNYLESFSENLLSNAQNTNDNVNKLLEDLNSVSLSLDIVKNDFCSLHNFQFVESRVYEEDETLANDNLQENIENEKPNNEEKQVQLDMKEAVLRGIEVVDKYFDKVEVPDSDSEDETDFPSFVLRPKDPYMDRPLPYVIGSDEWHKKWHVGLLDSSSDSETEKRSEKYSDSDSESELQIKTRIKQKEISNNGESEIDISNRNIRHPVANSTFDDSVNQRDVFGSSGSEEYNNAVPAQALISNSRFAHELAAKLGNVIEQNPGIGEDDINKRPIQSTVPSRNIGNIFSDEPPPIDDEDNGMFSSNNASQGLFSGSGGLFDDLDEDLWKIKKKVAEKSREVPKTKLPNLFDDDDDIFSGIGSQNKTITRDDEIPEKITSKNISKGGLFDEEDSEDDLFSDNLISHTSNNKSFLQPSSRTIMPYFAEEPPELIKPKHSETEKEDGVKSKKPISGVKIFSGTNLFAQKINKIETKQSYDDLEKSESASKINNKSNDLFNDFDYPEKTNMIEPVKVDSILETDTLNITTNKTPQIISTTEVKSKQLSLFDDDDVRGDELFGDDLFSNISTKKFVTNLFDDDLFATSTNNNNQNVVSTKSESSREVKPPSSIKSEKSQEVRLSPENEKTKTPDLLDTSEKEVKKSEKISLFSTDSEDESEDLFSTQQSKTPKTVNDVENKSDLQSDNNLSKDAQSSVGINLFDQHPPDDDNDWDTRSENNLFDDNYSNLFDNTPELSSQRSGLFDSEPPSLFYESSGIGRDASARAETDDSFNPFASSSRRFSSDIFNEQQSSDSFFITKNKSHLESNLGSITEISDSQADKSGDSYSNVEITPSGNIDDLFSDGTTIDENKQEEISKSVKLLDGNNEDKLTFSTKKNRLDDNKNVNLFESSTAGDDAKFKTEPEKIKPSVAEKPNLNLVENKTIQNDDGEEYPKDPVAAKIGSPGKLKHNININVSALIPGMSPPKKKDLQKSSSIEAVSIDDSVTTEISSPVVNNSTKTSEDLINKNQDLDSTTSITLSEDVTNEAEILRSITKDRVRIPVKRRPSTRKARQELIRNSGADFKLNLPSSDISDAETPTPQLTSTNNNNNTNRNNNNNKLEKQTEIKKQGSIHENLEDDLFADIKSISLSKSEQKIPTLFSSPESPDLPLFVEKSTKNKSEIPKFNNPDCDSAKSNDFKKSSLFDDEEFEDDIFSTRKLPPKSNILKKSLFDDEPDDDDIFGSASREVSDPTRFVDAAKHLEKKPSKMAHIKKLENTEVEDDPLSCFNDND